MERAASSHSHFVALSPGRGLATVTVREVILRAFDKERRIDAIALLDRVRLDCGFQAMASVQPILERLEEEGLIESEPTDSHRRRWFHSLVKRKRTETGDRDVEC